MQLPEANSSIIIHMGTYSPLDKKTEDDKGVQRQGCSATSPSTVARSHLCLKLSCLQIGNISKQSLKGKCYQMGDRQKKGGFYMEMLRYELRYS